MSFNFPENKKENKAQWHFLQRNERRNYEQNDEEINSDVLGSYTGTGFEDFEPVQDADDL